MRAPPCLSAALGSVSAWTRCVTKIKTATICQMNPSKSVVRDFLLTTLSMQIVPVSSVNYLYCAKVHLQLNQM